MFDKLYQKFSNDIGIDLGTANTLVYVKGHGIVINEPSIVAINQKTGQIVAVGHEAKLMSGKTPAHIKIIRPLVGGVVSDFEVTEEMLSYFLKKAEKISSKFFRPRVLLGVPSGITNVETRAVYDAAINAGAREVHLVEEAMAAAVGVRLPVLEAQATCVVDIGGGTTDIALISLGGMVRAINLKVAGDHFNQNIIDYIRDQFKLYIGDQTAEEVKIAIGGTVDGKHKEYEVRGRDLGVGLPRGIVVTDGDIRIAMKDGVANIISGIKEVLETAPPELMSDTVHSGIVLTGGGALMPVLADCISEAVSLPVFIAEEPLSAVARGLGIVLESFEEYKPVLLAVENYADYF